MARTLVVYFSRTGYTRRMAEEIARECKADIESIRDSTVRSGIFGYLRSAREALGKRTVSLEPRRYDPRDYDVVVLGTPVWGGSMSSPMRSYIAAHKGAFNRVAFFCTQGGSGAAKVFRSMAELCGKEAVATAFFNDRDIDRARYRDSMQQFDAAIGGA